MANLKSLAKDTAIYGLSSIVGRFINYLLTPLYTFKIAAASGDYGIITNIYAYTALILVILTFGMETTFFRFANKQEENPNKVYGTALWMVGGLSLLFLVLLLAFLQPINAFMGYSALPTIVPVMGLCVAIDAFQCIPFAYIRYQKRPLKFAVLKLFNILLLVTLNLCYFVVLPALHCNPFGLYTMDAAGTFHFNVAWVFYINLFCSLSLFVFLTNELKGLRHGFDASLMRRMFTYSWPILVLGIAGILNQTVDKSFLFPSLYKKADANTQLGIYGAASKIAMIMAMITQAFRYAYEPMVFAKAKDRDSKETYAQAMKYFVIFTLLAFLAVVGYLNILRYIIGSDYWDGLKVVPIVMAAEIMMGVYFNLSFWYKLIDKTIYGAIFSFIGCAVLVIVNVVFVPTYGYMACAWGGFAGYFTCMVLSYWIGQRKNPIDYPIRDMAVYLLLTIVLGFGMLQFNRHCTVWVAVALNTVLLAVFVAYLVWKDFPLRNLPIVGKYFRR